MNSTALKSNNIYKNNKEHKKLRFFNVQSACKLCIHYKDRDNDTDCGQCILSDKLIIEMPS